MDCRINQALTVIAGDLGASVEAVTVEDGAVFYDAGNGLCACQVDTDCGHECCAKAETAALMERARENFSR